MPQDVNDLVDDDDDDDSQLSDSDLVKKLRKQLRAKDKESVETAKLKRENAMLKAGVDTNTKLGALFAKSFEGDLSDVEAIKAEATELGIIQAPTTPGTEGEGDEGAGGEPAGENQAGQRADLATGAMPDDGKGVDPREAAVTSANVRLTKGDTFEKAAGGLISDLVQAAAAGDARVIVPKGNAY